MALRVQIIKAKLDFMRHAIRTADNERMAYDLMLYVFLHTLPYSNAMNAYIKTKILETYRISWLGGKTW